jgi:cyclohexadieny/prephenate dehydrogenase
MRADPYKNPMQTLAIVGVGLIGGAIGLAAKKRGLAQRIRGIGRDRAELETARKLGVIDEISLDLADGADADCVVFCTPVNRIAEQANLVAEQCRPDAILTDAGSTKQAIVTAVTCPRFVGAHPLAGSEKKGVEHAHADLFLERWTVLTPTERTAPDAVAQVRSFWEALGCRVRMMTPADHDRALALTSHLPHLVAAALAGTLPDDLRELTATGFRGTTRIAGGDPEVWTPIFQHNRTAVLAALDQLEARLQQFRQALATDDVARIDQLLTQGKKVRDALGS